MENQVDELIGQKYNNLPEVFYEMMKMINGWQTQWSLILIFNLKYQSKELRQSLKLF